MKLDPISIEILSVARRFDPTLESSSVIAETNRIRRMELVAISDQGKRGNQGIFREFNFCHENQRKIRKFNQSLEKFREFL